MNIVQMMDRADSICDSDCKLVNGCTGHKLCQTCNSSVCGYEVDDDGLCPRCHDEREAHTCQECGAYAPDLELSEDGLCKPCQDEADNWENSKSWAIERGGVFRLRAILIGLSLVSFCCHGAINYDRLLDAVEMVESDRGATSWNTYQVRQIWLEDCKRIGLIGNYATIREIARDRSLMRRLVMGYWGFYGSQYRRTTCKPVTAEVLARIHNGGPMGWKKKATASYWRRVMKYYK